MRNLSVRIKLHFLMFCFIASLAVVGAAGWLGIRNAGGSMEEVSGALLSVDALASLRHARLASVAAMQEGASWRPEVFDSLSDKSEALAEAHSLFGDILKRHREALAQAEQAFRNYDALPKSPEEQELWQEFSALWEEFHSADEVQTEICERLARAQEWHEVHVRSLELVTNTLPWAASTHAMGEPLEQLLKLGVNAAAKAQEGGESAIATAQTLIASVFGVAAVLLGGLAALIVRSVVTPLHQLRSTIEKVGQRNDFSLRARNQGRDEVAQAASAFNALLERVQGALREVMGGGRQHRPGRRADQRGGPSGGQQRRTAERGDGRYRRSHRTDERRHRPDQRQHPGCPRPRPGRGGGGRLRYRCDQPHRTGDRPGDAPGRQGQRQHQRAR